MRVEYRFNLDQVEVPCFSVETTEGPPKLFTLATLVLNVLPASRAVDLIFHSPNQVDLPKKIHLFRQIIESAPDSAPCEFSEGDSGSIGTSYFMWIRIRSTGARAAGSRG
jgi:hypothetical protein